MGNYRSQYEKYYGSIKKKAHISTKSKEFGLYSRTRNSKNGLNRIVDKLIKQLVGAFFLLGFLMIIKYMNVEGARSVYSFSKDALNYNLDIKETIRTISFPVIDEYKKKLLEAVEYNMK